MVELQTHFQDVSQALASLDLDSLVRLRHFVRECDGTLWVAGNGGSAANATHWACDLTKAANRRVRALGTNSAILTAWANDKSYESALSEELKSVSRPYDRLVCLSCSGTSPNIITLMRQAWKRNVPRALLTGEVWTGITPVDVVVKVASTDYAVIEDVHMAIGHWLTKELSGVE